MIVAGGSAAWTLAHTTVSAPRWRAMTSSGFDFATSDTSSSGVYLVTHVDVVSIDAAASHAGWLVRKVDLMHCSDKADALACVARGLDMPATWRGDWDAIAYGLRSLTWMSASGYVIVFDYADELRAFAPADFTRLLDVFDEAAFAWAERGVPFWAFFALHESAFETEDE
ncbi:MAG TPA: barstar family protein [Xanthomonadaceae bacterium]|nr:barstar family protein [Xanthomonadaceae bacterium]